MRIFFIAYISALVIMGILDGAWFSFSVGRIYRPGLGALMADKPLIPAALAFYLLYIAGLTYLIVLPALATNQFGGVVSRSAVFGLVAYGTYDLTNLAIVRGWPLNITLVDLVWGNDSHHYNGCRSIPFGPCDWLRLQSIYIGAAEQTPHENIKFIGGIAFQ